MPSRERLYEGTRIINAWERCEIELPDRSCEREEPIALKWVTRHREPEDISI